jgi:hypothetical protein
LEVPNGIPYLLFYGVAVHASDFFPSPAKKAKTQQEHERSKRFDHIAPPLQCKKKTFAIYLDGQFWFRFTSSDKKNEAAWMRPWGSIALSLSEARLCWISADVLVGGELFGEVF